MPVSVVHALTQRIGLPWAGLVGLAIFLFFAGLFVALALDGDLGGFWIFDVAWFIAHRPLTTVYFLAFYPAVYGLFGAAYRAAYPLTELGVGARETIVTPLVRWIHRRELLAFAGGAVLGALTDLGNTQLDTWIGRYDVLQSAVQVGVVTWLVFISAASVAGLRQVLRQPVRVDIFDVGAARPLTRQPLGVALIFIGGAVLAILTLPDLELLRRLEGTLVPAGCTAVALTFFVLGMLEVRRIVDTAKQRELTRTRSRIAELYERLHAGAGDTDATTATALLAYERRLERVNPWLYDTGSLRVGASVVLGPLLAVAARVLGGRLF
jgi:hypothetical protein